MLLIRLVASFALLVGSLAVAAQPPFAGDWEIDLRTPAQKKSRAECGTASFKLTQVGKRVAGEHSMATVGCGRLNEGGEVVGVASGNSATLTVTSGRNGQIVRGKATREANGLRWRVIEEVKSGEPEGDSGLILHNGLLRRVAR